MYIPKVNHRPKTLFFCCCVHRRKPSWCRQGQHPLYRSRQCSRDVWREACTNYRGLAVRKGARGPGYVACVFICLGVIIICRLHKLTLSDRAQVTLQLRQSVQCSAKILCRSILAGKTEFFFLFAGSQTRCRRSRP
jgi:hypothetical protein